MKFHSTKRVLAAGAAAVAIATLIAGCSSGAAGNPSEPSQGADGELTKVTIGETPGLPAAFTQFGVDKGFFEAEGLDVEVTTLQGGQMMASALLSGDVQFSGGDVVSFTKFRSQNVPVVIARPGSGAGDEKGNDYQAIVGNASIKSPEDLAGKTIAVNELNNVGQLFAEMALKRNYGVDTSTITWAEIPLPDTNAAIASGQVDAGYSLEPFQTFANLEGLPTILTQGVEYGANSQIGLVLTSEQFLASNPDAVAAFQRAHLATRNYILENEDEYRAALVELAGLEASAAESIRLPVYHEHVNRDTLNQVASDMLELGLIQSEVDTELFYAPDA